MTDTETYQIECMFYEFFLDRPHCSGNPQTRNTVQTIRIPFAANLTLNWSVIAKKQ